jgi:hypothetical protein
MWRFGVIADDRVVCSFTRVGSFATTLGIESFFSLFKAEREQISPIRSRDEPIDCIERFNNSTPWSPMAGSLTAH